MTLRARALSALGSVVLLLTTLALLWLAGEVVLRFAPWWSGRSADSPFNPYRPDGHTGFALRPGADAVHTTGEFSVLVHVNALGLRGPERTVGKPPHTARILVLGDSFAFGFGVAQDETFSAELERLLRERGLEVEVLSSGVPGWSLDNELVYLRTEGFELEPDLILLASSENDLSDLAWNRLTLDGKRLPVRIEALRRMIDPKGRMHYVNEGRYALPAFTFPGQGWLEDHSQVYHFLRLRLTKLSAALSVRVGRPPPPSWLKIEPARAIESLSQEEIQLALASSDAFQLRYHRFLAAALERLAAARGIPVRTLLASGRESKPAPGSPVAALHADCDSRPATCLDADLVLGRGPGRSQYFFHTDEHWNAAGHRRNAQALADWLAPEPALRAPAVPGPADSERGTGASASPAPLGP
jgi:lysophospholipase L1-like esterase